jgi:ubiquinone/menaquinone biosynthesis C-methylase UbiE
VDHVEEIKEFVRQTEAGLYLSRLSRGYMSSRIFLTSLELGIFSCIGTEKLRSTDIARELRINERAARVLLNALAGMELLRKSGDLYSNIREVYAYLDPGSPDYKGGSFFHDTALWDAWSQLTEIARSGECVREGLPNMRWQSLAGAMQDQARVRAATVANAVECTDGMRMLDLGGGPGSYAIAFADRYTGLIVDLLERDSDALKTAREQIFRHGLQERINIIRGNFFEDDLGEGYDIILLSSILCILGKEQNISLLGKVRDSLAEGGRIVVLDLEIDESGTRPVEAAIFSVHMMVTTHHGRLYSHNEVRDWLHQTGFRNVVKVPVERSLCLLAEK